MGMKKAKLIDIPSFVDERGALGVVEASQISGFDFRRVYYLYGSDNAKVRGKHAHKKLRQVMICLKGSVRVKISDGINEQDFVLNSPQKGLLIQAGCWRELDDFSGDAVIAVLASDEYQDEDYIRDLNDFQEWAKPQAQQKVPYLALDRMHNELELPISRAISNTIKAGQLIGGGIVTQFEKEFAEYCEAKHCISCGNGLDALAMILEALGVGQGDEVLVPSNSFIASALAVDMVGAKAVLVDCDPLTHSIELKNLDQYITPQTKAVMPVHLYGTPVDMEAISAFAKKHKLFVVEDAAQAHGARINGKRIGGLSDASGFSFYPTKNLGALGDGGGIITNNADLAEKIRMLGNYGSKIKYHHDTKGRNSRLDTIQAAVLSEKLKHLDTWNEKRRAYASLYQKELQSAEQIILPKVSENAEAVWHVFPIRVLNGQRDAMQKYLNDNGIGTNVHYPVPIHQQKAYADTYKDVSLPASEMVSTELLSLPLDPYHTEEEIAQVISVIKNFYKK